MVSSCSLLCTITEHGGMRSFENLSKTKVVFLAAKAEDLEAAVRTVVEVTFWMDWWTYSAKCMTF